MLSKIAFAHNERGEYVRAIHFYEELLQLLRNHGQSVHGIVTTLNHLGTLNVKLGRFIEAMAYHEEALGLVTNSSEFNEIDICEERCYIAVVLYKMGNFVKAMTIFEDALVIQTGILEQNHPKVAKSLYHLGVIKRIQYHHDQAMANLEAALKIQLQSLPKHHPDIMSTQMEIGITKLQLCQLDEAFAEFEALLDSQNYILGDVHPEIALTNHYMGVYYYKKNDMSNARKRLNKAFRMRQTINADCPEVATLLDDIGLIHIKKGKLDKALLVFQDAMKIRLEFLNVNHYEQSYGFFNLAKVACEKRDFSQAIAYYQRSMEIAVLTFGLYHPFIGDIHRGVGQVQERKCLFEQARHELLKALDIYKEANIPKSHEKVMEAQEGLVRVQHDEALYV